MKTMRMIGAAVVAVVLGAGVCACSDDDDDSGSSSSLEKTLGGTSWKVTASSNVDSYMWIGDVITFNKDKTATMKWAMPEDDDDEDKIIWGERDGYLVIVYNYDDYMVGTFVIDGKNATYTWVWKNYSKGTWMMPWDLSNADELKFQKQ